MQHPITIQYNHLLLRNPEGCSHVEPTNCTLLHGQKNAYNTQCLLGLFLHCSHLSNALADLPLVPMDDATTLVQTVVG